MLQDEVSTDGCLPGRFTAHSQLSRTSLSVYPFYVAVDLLIYMRAFAIPYGRNWMLIRVSVWLNLE